MSVFFHSEGVQIQVRIYPAFEFLKPDLFDFTIKSSKTAMMTLVFVLMRVPFMASSIKFSGKSRGVLIIGLLIHMQNNSIICI